MYILYFLALLPAVNGEPVPQPEPIPKPGPHSHIKYRHNVDIQGRVGCTTDGVFHPLSSIHVYISKKESLTEGYLDAHVSDNNGQFRLIDYGLGVWGAPATMYMGYVLSCDVIDFEKQFKQCKISCPAGKSWIVRKNLPFTDSRKEGTLTQNCQLDLDLAAGTLGNHAQPQEHLPTVYVPRELDTEARKTCFQQ